MVKLIIFSVMDGFTHARENIREGPGIPSQVTSSKGLLPRSQGLSLREKDQSLCCKAHLTGCSAPCSGEKHTYCERLESTCVPRLIAFVTRQFFCLPGLTASTLINITDLSELTPSY